LVKQCDHSAWKDSEEVTQSLLAEARIGAQHSQQARVMRLQFHGDETLFEGIRGVRANLREQEGNAYRWNPASRCPVPDGNMIHMVNYYTQ
jgi:hypothetical protein